MRNTKGLALVFLKMNLALHFGHLMADSTSGRVIRKFVEQVVHSNAVVGGLNLFCSVSGFAFLVGLSSGVKSTAQKATSSEYSFPQYEHFFIPMNAVFEINKFCRSFA